MSRSSLFEPVRTDVSRGAEPQLAGTLERGLRVLQCFGANNRSLGNRELADLTGLPRPTVSRLTHTLLELGYLRRCPDSRRFELGHAVLCLGYPVLARLEFRRVALPHMRQLALEIDGTVAIMVRDRLRMLTLENFTQCDVFGRRPETGVTISLVGTAAGRGWLVGASETEYGQVQREVAHAVPEALEPLQKDRAAGLWQMMRDGYVIRRGLLQPETAAISTPLRRRSGEELLVLSCGVRTPQPQAAELERRAARLLLETARRIADDLLKP